MFCLPSREEFYFMSNSYMSKVLHMGVTYENCECAYQSSKCGRHIDRVALCRRGAATSKREGGAVPSPLGWEHTRVCAMIDAVMSKFIEDAMAHRLKSTMGTRLSEVNPYNCVPWNACGDEESETLGLALEEVRSYLKELESTNMGSQDPFEPRVHDLPYRPRISVAILKHAMEGWDVSLNYESEFRPLVVLGMWRLPDGTTATVSTYSPELVSLGLTFDSWDAQYTAGLVKDMYLNLVEKGVKNVRLPGVIRKVPNGSQAMGKAIQLMYDEMAGGVSLVHHCSISKMFLIFSLFDSEGKMSVYRFTSETNVLLHRYLSGSCVGPSDAISVYTDESPRAFSRITISKAGFVQFTGKEEFSARLFRRLRRALCSMLVGNKLSEVLETLERMH